MRPLVPHRHRSRWNRPSLAVMLAMVCVVGQVWAGVHAAAVPHARCAEHGEIIHVGGHGASAVAAAEVPRGDDAAGRIARLAADGRAAQGDEHEHCCVMSSRRHNDVSFDVAVTRIPPVEAACAVPSVRVAVDSRALYRLAPKVSPPAQA